MKVKGRFRAEVIEYPTLPYSWQWFKNEWKLKERPNPDWFWRELRSRCRQLLRQVSNEMGKLFHLSTTDPGGSSGDNLR
jgi:hypothetical protein